MSDYKSTRNARIVKLIDDTGLSMRECARKVGLKSVSTVHKLYYGEKMRRGETRGIPKRARQQLAHLLK